MYCPRCGNQNLDTAPACQNCGQVLGGVTPPTLSYRPVTGLPVPTYLVQAILATLFCCMPFGIVAIVFAAQASGRQSAGDYAGAKDASDKAKLWCWISFGLGLAGGVIWILFAALSAAL